MWYTILISGINIFIKEGDIFNQLQIRVIFFPISSCRRQPEIRYALNDILIIVPFLSFSVETIKNLYSSVPDNKFMS